MWICGVHYYTLYIFLNYKNFKIKCDTDKKDTPAVTYNKLILWYIIICCMCIQFFFQFFKRIEIQKCIFSGALWCSDHHGNNILPYIYNSSKTPSCPFAVQTKWQHAFQQTQSGKYYVHDRTKIVVCNYYYRHILINYYFYIILLYTTVVFWRYYSYFIKY